MNNLLSSRRSLSYHHSQSSVKVMMKILETLHTIALKSPSLLKDHVGEIASHTFFILRSSESSSTMVVKTLDLWESLAGISSDDLFPLLPSNRMMLKSEGVVPKGVMKGMSDYTKRLEWRRRRRKGDDDIERKKGDDDIERKKGDDDIERKRKEKEEWKGVDRIERYILEKGGDKEDINTWRAS